jgi:hypothetical protein
MADPPSYDQDLLNRLNALRKTSITLDVDEYVRLPDDTTLALKRNVVRVSLSRELDQLQKQTWPPVYDLCVMELKQDLARSNGQVRLHACLLSLL